jgi:hypothetical protein
LHSKLQTRNARKDEEENSGKFDWGRTPLRRLLIKTDAYLDYSGPYGSRDDGLLVLNVTVWWSYKHSECEFEAARATNSRDSHGFQKSLRSPYSRLANTMMVFVTVTVLCSALFIILSRGYDDSSQKWAYGAIGSVIGFWFRRSG